MAEKKYISGNICAKCGKYKNATYAGYTDSEVAPYLCDC